MSTRRIGLVVPSSNTTMETELPALLRRRQRVAPDRFTFHSARMRMTQVTPGALAAMDASAERCTAELVDADVDVLAYACLVAVMVQGAGAHERAADRLAAAARADGREREVVTSAGALVDGLHALGARRVAMVTPYVPALTACVVDYLGDLGIRVVQAISLGVPDNREVGRLEPAALPALVDSLDLTQADAVVVSACVQMPSLPVVQVVEARTGLPTLSAATATAWAILRALGLPAIVPGAGRLLSGAPALARSA